MTVSVKKQFDNVKDGIANMIAAATHDYNKFCSNENMQKDFAEGWALKEGQKYISIEPLAEDLIIDFEIIYNNPLIRTRRKQFSFNNGDLTSIYNSKTFCLYEDIDHIKSQGLAQGGSLENAIVVKENRILNDDGLRYRDEFVNHKILDCMGDLMLTGHRIFGYIKTSQGGHKLTNVLLREFFSDKSNWSYESGEEKVKDPNKDNIYIKPVVAGI